MFSHREEAGEGVGPDGENDQQLDANLALKDEFFNRLTAKVVAADEEGGDVESKRNELRETRQAEQPADQ